MPLALSEAVPFRPAVELVMTIEPPPRAVAHDRQSGSYGLVDAGQVDVDDVLPVGHEVLGLAGQPDDPGVGDDDVDATEPIGSGLNRGMHVVESADVALAGEHAASFLFDQPLGFLEVRERRIGIRHRRDVLADVHAEDVRAGAGQSHGMRPTLAPGGSCDERDPSLE